MRIERIELRLLRLPLVRFFETSFGRIYDRSFVLVTVHGGGASGIAECVADANPFYSSETIRTGWHVIADFIAPMILQKTFDDPRQVYPALRLIRGHNMAKAAVEMAVWDLFARLQGLPLWRVLGGSQENVDRGIAAGVSIGIQNSLDELVERVRVELAAGYRRIKIKIKPGWDTAAVEAIRTSVGRTLLMVDANAAYSLADADRLAALDQYDLMMIEQPLDYDDIRDHATLQRQLSTPICLDESLHTVKIAEEAIEADACRVINIKPGRVGGHGPSVDMHDLAARHRIPVWHGGMLESGIGRAHNLHLSTLPNFTLPGDIAASRRYFIPDLIEPAIEVRDDGTIEVPQGCGIGVAIDHDRVAAATIEQLQIGISQ